MPTSTDATPVYQAPSTAFTHEDEEEEGTSGSLVKDEDRMLGREESIMGLAEMTVQPVPENAPANTLPDWAPSSLTINLEDMGGVEEFDFEGRVY